MIQLERGIARGSVPAGDHAAEVDIDVPSMPGVTVRARAHVLLVGRIRSGAAVTIALEHARRDPSGPQALVVAAEDLQTLPDLSTLAGMPVVVVGVRRAGTGAAAAAGAAGARAVLELPETTSGFWTRLLANVADPAPEVVVIAPGDPAGAAIIGNVLEGAAALGARPVAALSLVQAGGNLHVAPGSIEALRDHCSLGVNVAVPALDDPQARASVWNDLRRERLEERHQLVEVDVRAGSPASRPVEDLGAGAAGILAGRMAVGGRRWRQRA